MNKKVKCIIRRIDKITNEQYNRYFVYDYEIVKIINKTIYIFKSKEEMEQYKNNKTLKIQKHPYCENEYLQID